MIDHKLEVLQRTKRALEVPPISKENGCRFYDYKPSGVKVTVGKVIAMMNLLSLSQYAVAEIIRGAVTFKLVYSVENGLAYEVCYPNVYNGVRIFGSSDAAREDMWKIEYIGAEDGGKDYDACESLGLYWRYFTEREVIALCASLRASGC